MEKFTVARLAKIAGVSVRTLHHYDDIGLLKPSERTDAGYRHYGHDELLRLQQILFYKELDIPLHHIANILDDPDFDIATALLNHKEIIDERIARLQTLQQTIHRTIADLKNKNMNYEKMYEGFSKEQVAAYEQEVTERWGADTLEKSKQRVNAMSKEQAAALKQEMEDVHHALAAMIGRHDASAPEAQALVKRHYAVVCGYNDFTPEVYAKLGNMYVEDERFRATFDKYHIGLAEFLRDAIKVFVLNGQ